MIAITVVFLSIYIAASCMYLAGNEAMRPFGVFYENMDENEIRQEIRKEFRKKINEWKNDDCDRPVLRGRALEGSSTKKVADIIFWSGDFSCEKTILDLVQKEGIEFYSVSMEDIKNNRHWAKKYFDNIEPLEVEKVEENCNKYLDRIAETTRHEMACSPHSIKKRYASQKKMPIISLQENIEKISLLFYSKAMGNRFKQRDFKKTYQDVFDWIMFFQDLCRGGTLICKSAVKEIPWALKFVEKKVDKSCITETVTLESFVEEANLLQDTWPGMYKILSGETFSTTFELMYWDSRRKCWRPRDDSDEFWISLRRMFGEDETIISERGCVVGNMFDALCYNSITHDKTYKYCCNEGKKDYECIDCTIVAQNELDYWKKWVETETPQKRWIRKYIYGKEEFEIEWDYNDFLTDFYIPDRFLVMMEYSLGRFLLQGLIVKALCMIEEKKEGKCPGEQMFEKDTIKNALIDPGSGEKMVVEKIDEGKWILKRDWHGHWIFGGEGPVVEIECSKE